MVAYDTLTEVQGFATLAAPAYDTLYEVQGRAVDNVALTISLGPDVHGLEPYTDQTLVAAVTGDGGAGTVTIDQSLGPYSPLTNTGVKTWTYRTPGVDNVEGAQMRFTAKVDLAGVVETAEVQHFIYPNTFVWHNALGQTLSAEAVTTGPVSPPVSTITHGQQLTKNMTGPWALQNVAPGAETLWNVTGPQAAERISTYPGWGRPSYIPGTDYVYNNSPSNHGGVVPTGGLTIDGYTVAAGTWVVQFANYQGAGVVIEGDAAGGGAAWPGVLFRGCRFRGTSTAPGFFNFNGIANNGKTRAHYCDAGGTGYTTAEITESIFESQGIGANDRMYLVRNYLSIATTLAFLRNSGDAAIENYCENVPPYYSDDTYHLNGLANSGGQTATMWARNCIDLSPQPGASPYYKAQNDAVQMAADNGAYLGTGTNIDGSTGYQIKDNYIAGATNTLQLGVDKANTSADVKNVNVTGNKFSTKWFPNCGQTGISYKNPTWGSLSNLWSNNTWADDYGTGNWSPTTGNTARQYPSGAGPRAGGAIAAPTG